MDPSLIALIGFAALFALLLLRVPVGISLLLVGTVGIYSIRPQAALPVVAGEIFNQATNPALTIIPLFILMGNFAGISGLSRDLFNAAQSWFGHKKGGLASASIIGCAGFSAMSGSSLASALTMGRVVLPEMRRYNYDDGLATSAIAAGGTLGILIPPSSGFVVYSLLTEQSIGRLFMAGILPGLLLTLLFVLTIKIIVNRTPAKAPDTIDPAPLGQRVQALARAAVIIGIILVTIGGIYFGVFSAIEAAGVGAFLTLLIAIYRRAVSWKSLEEVITSTLKSTGTVFLILFGAFVFKTFIGFSGVAFHAANWVQTLGISGNVLVVSILLFLMFIGMFLEGFTILVLVVPLVQPILEPLGVDMIWFGVLLVIVLEMALISPPVGLNIFAVKGIAADVPISTMFRSIWPFWIAMFVAVAAVYLIPVIALFIPNSMFG